MRWRLRDWGCPTFSPSGIEATSSPLSHSPSRVCALLSPWGCGNFRVLDPFDAGCTPSPTSHRFASDAGLPASEPWSWETPLGPRDPVRMVSLLRGHQTQGFLPLLHPGHPGLLGGGGCARHVGGALTRGRCLRPTSFLDQPLGFPRMLMSPALAQTPSDLPGLFQTPPLSGSLLDTLDTQGPLLNSQGPDVCSSLRAL